MKKSNEKLNILRDIGVYEYVADDQSDPARAQFEEALNGNPELEQEVAAEQELRALIAMTQPASIVSDNNIDKLFDRINTKQTLNVDTDSVPANDTLPHELKPQNKVIGFAIAASLLLAVFFTVNFGNDSDQLEPDFVVLFDQNNNDFKSLSNQNRLVKLTLESPLSSQALDELMNKYQLQNLNQLNNTITASALTVIDNKKLAIIKADRLIKEIALYKF